MDAERQKALSDFTAKQMGRGPKSLRNAAIVMLVLCGGGAALLAGVFSSGSATLDDVGLPLVLFAVFAASSLLLLVWKLRELRSIPSHPLVLALRDRPSDVIRVTPTSIGGAPGLTFEMNTGVTEVIFVADPTRAEMMAWLSKEGAHVG